MTLQSKTKKDLAVYRINVYFLEPAHILRFIYIYNQRNINNISAKYYHGYF
jgi:predicted transcriptional regulator